jgi:hypothetical protein
MSGTHARIEMVEMCATVETVEVLRLRRDMAEYIVVVY